MRDIQEPPVKVWLVWSNEGRAWWGQNGCRYVHDLWQAGRYSEAEALKACQMRTWAQGAIPPEVMVPAPENDQDKFSVDDLRHMPERMATKAAEATREALARRRAEQAGEAPR